MLSVNEDAGSHGSATEGVGYERLIAALRCAQDAIHDATMPLPDAQETAELLHRAARLARRYAAPPEDRPVSCRPDLPGRGNAMVPAFVMRRDERDPLVDVGSGEFASAYEGRSAVHGGAVALLFDEVLGRLVERNEGPSRTAYLHVNYRNLTPINTELHLRVRIDSINGRKTFASGWLRDGDGPLADAEGLWLRPRIA